MSTFNIMASCVCRDIFRVMDIDEHKIISFLQFSTPLRWFVYKEYDTLFDNASKIIEVINKSNVANFYKKCFLNDFKNTYLQYFSCKSDFIIIDLIEMARFGLVKCILDNKINYFTYSGCSRLFLKDINHVAKLDFINPQTLLTEKNIDLALSKYQEWIFEKYDYDKIILIKTKHSDLIWDNFGIHKFDN